MLEFLRYRLEAGEARLVMNWSKTIPARTSKTRRVNGSNRVQFYPEREFVIPNAGAKLRAVRVV